jgi:hypothetical protein
MEHLPENENFKEKRSSQLQGQTFEIFRKFAPKVAGVQLRGATFGIFGKLQGCN